MSSSEKEEHFNFAVLFTQECLPQVFKGVQKEDESVEITDALKHLYMLLFGLYKTYVVGLKCWQSKTTMCNEVSDCGNK